MTINQKLAALLAIRMRQNDVRDYLRCGLTPVITRHMTHELEDLAGAYDAINAMEVD